MAILSEYIEVMELDKEAPTTIYLPNVKDMEIIDNRDLDGSDEVTEEYCKINMKDGMSYIFRSSLFCAINLYRDIMRFKVADIFDVRTNKIFVY